MNAVSRRARRRQIQRRLLILASMAMGAVVVGEILLVDWQYAGVIGSAGWAISSLSWIWADFFY